MGKRVILLLLCWASEQLLKSPCKDRTACRDRAPSSVSLLLLLSDIPSIFISLNNIPTPTPFVNTENLDFIMILSFYNQ